MPPLVLVTGGAGYIGSVVTDQLLQDGYRVRVLDMLMHGGSSLLPYIHNSNFEFVHGDIRNRRDLSRSLDSVDMVIHLAAIVGDPACAKQPKIAVEINKDSAQMLCDMAIEFGVSRFLFVSTCSNYGKMDNSEVYVDENSPLKPVSLYAELKVGFEQYLQSKSSSNFVTICLRFATAYGISPRPRFDLTVNEFTRDIFCNKTLKVYGEQFWRPYCHTTDLATACRLALKAENNIVNGQAFNIGATKENYRKKDIIELILKQLPGRADCIQWVERTEDPRDYRVNCDKVARDLHFRVSRTVTDGIMEIIGALKSKLIDDPYDLKYQNLT